MPSNADLFNLIAKSQRTRLEDQRTSVATASSTSSASSSATSSSSAMPSSSAQQQTQPQRLSSSTSSLTTSSSEPSGANKSKFAKNQAVTMPPDDEFFSMIQKIQSRRLDEQRTAVKPSMFAASGFKKKSVILASANSSSLMIRGMLENGV